MTGKAIKIEPSVKLVAETGGNSVKVNFKKSEAAAMTNAKRQMTNKNSRNAKKNVIIESINNCTSNIELGQ